MAMVKLGVPVVDRGMVAAERNLKIIVLLEPDNTALHFDVEASGWGRARSGVGPGGQAQFTKDSHLLGKIGVEVQDELPFVKSALDSVLIGGDEIEIAKSGDLEG